MDPSKWELTGPAHRATAPSSEMLGTLRPSFQCFSFLRYHRAQMPHCHTNNSLRRSKTKLNLSSSLSHHCDKIPNTHVLFWFMLSAHSRLALRHKGMAEGHVEQSCSCVVARKQKKKGGAREGDTPFQLTPIDPPLLARAHPLAAHAAAALTVEDSTEHAVPPGSSHLPQAPSITA